MKKKNYAEHKAFARRNKIQNLTEWTAAARVNKSYYHNPKEAFPNQFEGWDEFFGREKKEPKKQEKPKQQGKIDLYEFKEACLVVGRVNIQNITEYNRRFTTDPRLPNNPKSHYHEEWGDVSEFFALSCVGVHFAIMMYKHFGVISAQGARIIANRYPFLRLPRSPLTYYRAGDKKILKEFFRSQVSKRKVVKVEECPNEKWFRQKRTREAYGMARDPRI